MQQGEGDDAAELKEAPQDFALWKARKEGEDTWWESPWGEGRPGWHIECSAMAEAVLGVTFEIHGGGSDLVFPHHENEIAQTEAARGKPLSRTWMHNGMVEMGDEKMAKSVGNIRLLHERARPVRARRLRHVDGRRALPQAGGLFGGGARGRDARGGARARRVRRLDERRRPGSTSTSSASSTRWRTTSTRRRPAPCCSSGCRGQPPHGRGRATRAGPAPGDALRARARDAARGRGGGARGAPAAGRRARGGARRARLRARRPDPRPACRRGLGDPRHAGGRPASCARRDRLRPQRGAGGAARQAPGAARVRERAGRPRGLARRRRDA